MAAGKNEPPRESQQTLNLTKASGIHVDEVMLGGSLVKDLANQDLYVPRRLRRRRAGNKICPGAKVSRWQHAKDDKQMAHIGR